MKIIADTHTHTVASHHAYSTLEENLAEAKRKGLRFLATTDHTGIMPGAPHSSYFVCMQSILPHEHNGVYIVQGCEANILDETGAVDIKDGVMDELDWVIASFHKIVTAPMDYDRHTAAWLAIAKNPHIDVIGHCGEERFKFDYERVIKEFAHYGKIVEINASSAQNRPTSRGNCTEIARICAKHGVPLVLSSDAHFSTAVGDVAAAIKIVEEAGVPEELILNADEKRFAARLSEICGKEYDV